MGELIEYDFSKNRRNDSLTEKEAIDRFVVFVKSHKKEKLMNLQTSKNSLQESALIVSKYTTTELIDWLEQYEENDWQKKPGFFQAIFIELTKRLKLFIQNNPK